MMIKINFDLHWKYWLLKFLGHNVEYLIGPKVFIWGRGDTKNNFTKVYDENFKKLWSVEDMILGHGKICDAYIDHEQMSGKDKFAFRVTVQNKIASKRTVYYNDWRGRRISQVTAYYEQPDGTEWSEISAPAPPEKSA
jgi:hypothetical protein